MSVEARRELVQSPNTIFQKDSQRSDFLDPSKTRTETIALVLELVEKGHILEFTAVNSDHHDDSHLGIYCHHNGAAFDFWPLVSTEPGDYADAASTQMKSLVRDLMASRWTQQIGLAGSAQTTELLSVAGYSDWSDRVFPDAGDDHIHAGCIFTPGA